MKSKAIYLFLSFISVILLTSCLGSNNDDTELSSNPRFVSLTFTKNDSIPGLEDVVFTLLDDSITIVNLDSLPYGTRIDSVIPVFYFKSSSLIFMYSDTDTILITGTDTIDFNRYTQVHNFAGDVMTDRLYNIKVNVHQVEPELYVWKKLQDNIANAGSNQKAILFEREGYAPEYLYYFTGTDASLYSSHNGETWNNQSLTNFPANADLWYLTQHNNSLFVSTTAQELYQSADGRKWNRVNYTLDNNNEIHSLLFSMRGRLWALAKNTGNVYSFISSDNGTNWQIIKEIPANFPVSDYSALVFNSFLGNEKAIVLGGANAQGQIVKMNWSSEDGQNWADLGKENNSLGEISRAGIVQYDQKLFLFGGKNSQNQPLVNNIRESLDQGLSWQVPDSTYNVLPATYKSRINISALLSADSRYIMLIGGVDDNTIYSDLWSAKVNKIDFLRK